MNNIEVLAPLKQGDRIELKLTDLSDSGDGVGRFRDLVIFVPNTVPGDRIVARLTQVKSSYANGARADRPEPCAARQWRDRRNP